MTLCDGTPACRAVFPADHLHPVTGTHGLSAHGPRVIVRTLGDGMVSAPLQVLTHAEAAFPNAAAQSTLDMTFAPLDKSGLVL